MSVASADAGTSPFPSLDLSCLVCFAHLFIVFSSNTTVALLSAARAYASLKMNQNTSNSSSSSSSSATLPPASPISVSPNKSKTPIHYSRKELLALAESPLCIRPQTLKPLKDWFGCVCTRLIYLHSPCLPPILIYTQRIRSASLQQAHPVHPTSLSSTSLTSIAGWLTSLFDNLPP